MNRLNWVLLALGVVGLITAIILMRKKGGCSCNGNGSVDSTLQEAELNDGTQVLVNQNNEVVASRGISDTSYTVMSKSGSGSTLVGMGKTKCSTVDFPYYCEKNGYCTKDKATCDNW